MSVTGLFHENNSKIYDLFEENCLKIWIVPELTTASKVGVATIVGVGGGTGIYYSIGSKGEEEDDSTIVEEDSSERLSVDSDWEARESSYYDSYLMIHPHGGKRIKEIEGSKSESDTSKLVKQWCEGRWSSKKITRLTKYWCYAKETFLDKSKSEKGNVALKNYEFSIQQGGEVLEYKTISEGLESGSDDKGYLDRVFDSRKEQNSTTTDWCKAEAGIFYEGETTAYRLFGDNCLKSSAG